MKHAFAFSAAALAALLVSGAAQARDAGTGPSGTSRDTSKDSTSTSQSQSGRTTAAARPRSPARSRCRTRSRAAWCPSNKKANSVNVKDNDGKELTLVADAETAAELSRLKVGDQVKISYKKNKQDQMVATKITTTSTANGAGSTSKAK
jgi:hypothetical protein